MTPEAITFCKTCALWDRKNALDKAGRVRNDRAALCLWKSTEVWPESVRAHLNRKPTPSFMTADMGRECPCWTPLRMEATP
jgi:hypothetical protein